MRFGIASTPTRCAPSIPTTRGPEGDWRGTDPPRPTRRGGREHFEQVKAVLDRNGVRSTSTDPCSRPRYYTRTLFEFEWIVLGAQSGIGGGGRYDGLIGNSAAAHTWLWVGPRRWTESPSRSSSRRTLLRARPRGADGCSSSPRRSAAARTGLVTELRRAGIRADLDLAGRAIKGR